MVAWDKNIHVSVYKSENQMRHPNCVEQIYVQRSRDSVTGPRNFQSYPADSPQ